jgi:ATP-binding protein involved in chromosome partitioning
LEAKKENLGHMVTQEAIIEALRQVREPERGRGLVTLNMVRDIEVEGDSAAVVLTIPACPLEADIKARCEVNLW